MTNDLNRAKNSLLSGDYTCVMCKEGKLYTNTERGIGPLIEFIDSGTDFNGFSAADLIVGRAAAFLYILLGAVSVYADVISEGAALLLRENGISSQYRVKTKEIRNRSNTGLCPMEEAVENINEPQEALAAIRKRLAEIRK